jgi:predicted neuraminidase
MIKSIFFVTLMLLLGYGKIMAQGNISGKFIFTPQEKHVHGSSIVECPNGDLLACWFYGSGERTANDVLIQGARLKKGTNEWSQVFIMADTPNLPDCNPVLFIDNGEKLWLFWIAVQASRWERSILKYRTSIDYQTENPPKWNWQDVILFQPGNAFSERVAQILDELDTEEGLWAEYALPYSRLIKEAAQDPVKRQTGWMTRIHPITLPSGRILLPLYSDGFNVSLVAISDDQGETWHASLPMVGFGPIQPTIVRKKDGTLVSYMRDSGDAPNRVMISTSIDQGKTWSAAVDTNIPNPGSSLEVISIKDGRWVMIFNDTEDGRHQLALALSDDEGMTWKWKRYLEKGEGSYAYPSIIQAKDEKLHATYSYHLKTGRTIKHVNLDVDWILKGNN